MVYEGKHVTQGAFPTCSSQEACTEGSPSSTCERVDQPWPFQHCLHGSIYHGMLPYNAASGESFQKQNEWTLGIICQILAIILKAFEIVVKCCFSSKMNGEHPGPEPHCCQLAGSGALSYRSLTLKPNSRLTWWRDQWVSQPGAQTLTSAWLSSLEA